MVPQEQSTQTDRSPFIARHFLGLNTKDALKLASSLLLPLVLGIFTVVITFQQQQAARQQRDEDRTASELQRDLERNLSDEKYKNELLDTYVKEMGQLMREKNGSLTEDDVTAVFTRVKTLNIFRQLDPQRNARILRFLHEAKQLYDIQKNRSLDLSTAKLRDIDFRDIAVDEKQLTNLSLVSTFLSNITCIKIEMRHVDFTHSRLDTANFSSGNLVDVSFSRTHLRNIDFSSIQLDTVEFSSAVLENVNFSGATLMNVNFFKATLHNVDLSSCLFESVRFSSAQLNNVNFSFANLFGVQFLNAKLSNVAFVSSRLFTVDFQEAEFNNGNFAFAILNSAELTFVVASDTHFRQATAIGAFFYRAKLSHSTFIDANVKYVSFAYVTFNNVDFSRANLYKANFAESNVEDHQLHSALLIQDIKLPNRTRFHDTNLIINGDADCKTALVDAWALKTGSVTTVLSYKDNTDCRFTLQSLTSGATMFQRIDLSSKWDSRSWPNSKAILSATMSTDVSILLRGIKLGKYTSDQQRLFSTEEYISMVLSDDTRELEVLIEFSAVANSSNDTSHWCDSIKLFIEYGTDLEPSRVPMRASWIDISHNARWSEHGQTLNDVNFVPVPQDVFISEDQIIYIIESVGSSIWSYKEKETEWKQIIGMHGRGSDANQLDGPMQVIVDMAADTLVICDRLNRRVVRWPRQNGTRGVSILQNINCAGLTMDTKESLYVTDIDNHEVRRYLRGQSQGTVVVGGNGRGNRSDQLNSPTYIFVDRDHSIFVSDSGNDRVMKWVKESKTGIVVAAGQGKGAGLSQLSKPAGVLVDQLGTVYVSDTGNNRVVRWPKGAQQGTTVVGTEANQLYGPTGLSFDRHGHLYVVERDGRRMQKFLLETSSK